MKKILIFTFLVIIVGILIVFIIRCVTTSQLQRIMKTTKEQTKEIEVILSEHKITFTQVTWAERNQLLSNQGIYEYYELVDADGIKYIITLSVPDKEVLAIEKIISSEKNEIIYKQ